jgi:hypothetical protein
MRTLKAFFTLSLTTALWLSPNESSAQTANDGTTWGWWLVGGSVIVGTTTVLLGLNIDCTRTDVDCQREASVLIWGGIGAASVGTLAGITIVQWGERQRAPSKPTISQYSLSLKPFSSGAPFEAGERGSLLLFSFHVP